MSKYIGFVEKYNNYLFNYEKGTFVKPAEEGLIGFSYQTDGYGEVLELNPVTLWSYEDDGREFIEEINKYEPMDALVLRKLKGHMKAVEDFISFLEDGLNVGAEG